MTRLPRVYLAGPDVFRAEALAFGASLKQACERNGLLGLWPLDIEPPVDTDKWRQSDRIRRANETMIVHADAVVANISPFRGPHMDPGTAYEFGYARALGKPLFAYSAARETLLQRIVRIEGGRTKHMTDDRYSDAYGYTIENFELPENLMIATAVDRVYETPFETITACADWLRQFWRARA